MPPKPKTLNPGLKTWNGIRVLGYMTVYLYRGGALGEGCQYPRATKHLTFGPLGLYGGYSIPKGLSSLTTQPYTLNPKP